MSALARAWRRVGAVFRRDALDRDFADEAESHIGLAIEEYTSRGMAPSEAERLARLRFGGIAASRDAHRDSRALPWVEELAYDLRLTLRGLRRDRGFAVAVVAMLAVALALHVTVFTIVQAMLFRGLPLAEAADRLVYIQKRQPDQPWGASWDDVGLWRDQAPAFAGIGVLGNGRVATLRDNQGPAIETRINEVSVNAFGLLGVPPMLGRDFVAADATASAGLVAILSHHFWAARFGRNADVIGSTVRIDDQLVTIVGVMPERFALVYEQDLWMPVRPAMISDRRTTNLMVFARLADGVTVEQARVEVETIHARLEANRTPDRINAPLVLRYSEAYVAEDAPAIYGALWAGAWFVLLIACANVANLGLVRTMSRWRDVSTRIALGAGQWRMLRLVMAESLMLTSIGAAIAWAVVNWSVPTWARMTASPYVALDYTVGSDVLGCLLVTSAAVAVLCAVPTMVRVAQLGAGGALKGDARGVTRGLRATHLSAVLVSVQVALAVVLLAGAGVLAQSLLRIVSADTGVRSPEQLLVGTLRMAPDTYASPDATQAYFRRLQDELRTISGIESFALTTALPGIGWGPERAFQVEGQASGSERIPSVNVLTAGTDYFEVLGRAMTAGRGFASRDDANGLAVAIVNERFVETVLQGEQGVGRRVRLVSGNVPGPWMTIVGVAPNIKQADPTRQQFKPLLYVPFASQRAPRGVNIAGTRAFRGANLLVRTSMTAEQAASLVRTGVRRIDADVTLEELAPFRSTLGFNRDLTDLAHAELGKHAAIAPTYALVALLLAGVGLYAVIAHSVGQRTQEIGVRVVVGASARDIRRLILAEGLRPVTYGLAAGLVISLGANGLLRSQLVGVSPYDLPTLMVAPALLLLVAVVACHIPARRALRVEPAVALRQD